MDICILALEHGAEPLVAGDPTTAATIVAGTPTLELTTLAGTVLADTWVTVWSAGTASDAKVRHLMRRVPLTTTAEAHRN
jgi:hypothetical protein